MKLRIGTRGSELALWQSQWVCDQLRAIHPGLECELVTIKTHGDTSNANFDRNWPTGAFVKALEDALLRNEVDLCVHSYKDMQTAETPGLAVAATPPREVPNDVLITRKPSGIMGLRPAARIGTNSPRRAAQLLEYGAFEIVPIRGNVPTRIAKLTSENLDAIVLAAAGLKRLGLNPSYTQHLPAERFMPAPGQGALAVQTRRDDPAYELCRALDDEITHTAVLAERGVLARLNAGCHTPVAALATALVSPHTGGKTAITLRAKLFTDNYVRSAEGIETGPDPLTVAYALADRLRAALS